MLDRLEANRLVQVTSWVVVVHAEAQSRMPLSNAGLDELDEEPSSDPQATTWRDDGDGELGDVLGNEAIAVVHLGVGPIPSRAQRSVLFGNQPVVALPWPPSEVHGVPGIGHHLARGRRRLVWPPDGSLAEHRREKGNVISFSRAVPDVVHTWNGPHRGILPDQQMGVVIGRQARRCRLVCLMRGSVSTMHASTSRHSSCRSCACASSLVRFDRQPESSLATAGASTSNACPLDRAQETTMQ